MTVTIKLMAEYAQTILWGVDRVGPIDPESLPITAELKAALQKWAEAYDATFDHEDPRASGFRNAVDERAFEEEGRRLWQELKTQLRGKFNVVYFSWHDHQMHE